MGDTVTAEIVKRRDRGLLDKSLNIRGVAFTNGGINFKYAKLRLAQWALRPGTHGRPIALLVLKETARLSLTKTAFWYWRRNQSSVHYSR